jgi:large subunit ribosomal protein L21
MYAVIRTGGKQYRVSPGESIDVEKLPHAVGEQIELNEVLLIADGAQSRIGQPLVEGAMVKATVTRQAMARKVIIFKFRRNNRYRRMKGHRQEYTRLRIDEIAA